MWLLQHTNNLYGFDWVTVHVMNNAVQIWYNISGCTALYFLVLIIMIWLDTIQDIQSMVLISSTKHICITDIIIQNAESHRSEAFRIHYCYAPLTTWLLPKFMVGWTLFMMHVMQLAKWINVYLLLSHSLNHEFMGVCWQYNLGSHRMHH